MPWRARPADGGLLAVIPLTAALVLPAWLTLSAYLHRQQRLHDLGRPGDRLRQPHPGAARRSSSSGIWLDGDFRSFPAAALVASLNHLLIWIVFAGAVLALGWTLWQRNCGVALYVGYRARRVAVLSVVGTVPWIMGKSLAISSPAVLLAGLAGGAILFGSRHVAAALVGDPRCSARSPGGVLWSNFLQYRNVTLAPRARLAELADVGSQARRPRSDVLQRVRDLRRPPLPARRRTGRARRNTAPVNLPTLGNALLTKPAWAEHRLLRPGDAARPTARSCSASARPRACRRRSTRSAWAGRYYQLWQQPAHPTMRVLAHYAARRLRSPTPTAASPRTSRRTRRCARSRRRRCRSARRCCASAAPPLPTTPSCSPTSAPTRSCSAAPTRVGRPAHGSRTPPTATLTPTIAGARPRPRTSRSPTASSGYQLWLGRQLRPRLRRHGRRPPDRLGRQRAGPDRRLRAGRRAADALRPASTRSRSPTAARTSRSGQRRHRARLRRAQRDRAVAAAVPVARLAARCSTVAPNARAALCGRSLDWIEVVKPPDGSDAASHATGPLARVGTTSTPRRTLTML